MHEVKDLVRRLDQFSTNALAKNSGLTRPAIAAIRKGVTKDMRTSTFNKLLKAVDAMEVSRGATGARGKRRVVAAGARKAAGGSPKSAKAVQS